jgi:hypothetical protein
VGGRASLSAPSDGIIIRVSGGSNQSSAINQNQSLGASHQIR